MPIVGGTPLSRANDGIFCGPIGRASIGYWCFVGDVIKPGGGANRPTGSLPYSGDKFKKQLKKKVEDMDLTDWEKQRIIEDEEILWIIKMFLTCQS